MVYTLWEHRRHLMVDEFRTSSAAWGVFMQHITNTQTCDGIAIRGTAGKIRTH